MRIPEDGRFLSQSALVSFFGQYEKVPTRKPYTAPQSEAALPALVCLSTNSKIGALYLCDCYYKRCQCTTTSGNKWQYGAVNHTYYLGTYCNPRLNRGGTVFASVCGRGASILSSLSAAHFPSHPSCWATWALQMLPCRTCSSLAMRCNSSVLGAWHQASRTFGPDAEIAGTCTLLFVFSPVSLPSLSNGQAKRQKLCG